MSRASDRLREFHEAFDVPMGDPSTAEMVKRRRRLHREEHRELQGALKHLARLSRGDFASHSRDSLALGHIARELADVMVVAYGTADLFGIDLDAAFDAVMDANMAKLPVCDVCGGRGWITERTTADYDSTEATCEACDGTGKGKPIKRLSDGKVLRPESWQPPDMSGAIK